MGKYLIVRQKIENNNYLKSKIFYHFKIEQSQLNF